MAAGWRGRMIVVRSEQYQQYQITVHEQSDGRRASTRWRACIAKVSEELSYPGTNTVFRVLQQRGVRVTRQQVDRYVRGQAERQLVGADQRPLRGKVEAGRRTTAGTWTTLCT
jgi:hypothetical protein